MKQLPDISQFPLMYSNTILDNMIEAPGYWPLPNEQARIDFNWIISMKGVLRKAIARHMNWPLGNHEEVTRQNNVIQMQYDKWRQLCDSM